MKKSAIAITCVLCTLMLITTVFSVSVNAVKAATTEVLLTVEETTVTTATEEVSQPQSDGITATPDDTPKKDDSTSVQTGNTVCIAAATLVLMSGLVTIWFERKRKR